MTPYNTNHTILWNTCKKILYHSQPSSVDWPLKAITHDGRLATCEHLFIPLKRTQGSIVQFVHQALNHGCRAILVDAAMAQGLENIPQDVLAVVPDFHAALATVYPLFYPYLPQCRVGITGTDGKTSTAHFLHQLWTLTGQTSATIGTMGIFSTPPMESHIVIPNGMTTPPQPYLYELLSWYKQYGKIDHVVFEASSHALAQSRLEPLRLTIGMMTNFAQDHLDYHSNLYGYWQAKWRIFTQNMIEGSDSFALIHNSIPVSISDYERIPKTVHVLRYGKETQSIAKADNATYRIVNQTMEGQNVVFSLMGEQWQGYIPLQGDFQISNVLGALSAFACAGGNLEDAFAILPQLKPVLGRMEYVCTHNKASIYVDYAHTPQGLALALQALRASTTKKLGVVFGCGGARDALKRPMMGQVAARYSDWVVVTDDNPRTENPEDIRQHIIVGCPGATSIGPRSSALRYALDALQPGDTLLIAGKGHETTQIVGNHILEHSDQDWVRSYCASQDSEV